LGIDVFVQAAAGTLAILTLGSLAAGRCRQPVRRARLVMLTLLGGLLVPAFGTLPLAPRWSVARFGPRARARPEATVVAPADTLSARVAEIRLTTDAAHQIKAVAKRARSALAPLSFALPWRVLGLAAYASISAGLLAWWLVGQALLWRVTRTARPVAPAVRSKFAAIAGPAGRRVRLLESDRIEFPFTFTWARPVVVLPAALGSDAGDDDLLRYCLAHEWAHVERRDAWAWNLAVLAGTLLYYQPLFWWLRRQLRLCQDYLADDRAAAHGSREDYAAYLVRLAGRCRRGSAASLPVLGIEARASNLRRRISLLVTESRPLEHRCGRFWTVAAAAATASMLLVVSGLRLHAAAPNDDPQPAAEKAAPAQPAAPHPPGETLRYSGKVKDKDTGQPIAGATVVVRRSVPDPRFGGDRIIEETQHTTNADGVYAFTIPPEQVAEKRLYIELDVEHPDYATRARFGYALGMIRKNETLGERPFFENVELRPAQPILGRIETPDGMPATGVELLAYSNTDKFKPGSGTFEYGSFSKAVTDQEGRFRMPVITPGPAVFWILPREYAPEMHAVPEGKRGDLGRFVLQKGVTVTGRAFDAQGKPLPGMFVGIERIRGTGADSEILNRLIVSDAIRRTTETDAEGRFTFDPMPAGSFRVQPVDYQHVPHQGLIRRALPGVFAPQKMTLTEGETPEPLEIRAAPHVVIEGGWVDSKGNPRGGWSLMIAGRIDGQFWHTQGQVSADGKFSVKVPHGLEQAQIDIMTNEHGSMRYRIGKDGMLKTNRNVMLGTLDHDIKDFTIIRYDAPVVLIKTTTSDGQPVKDVVFAGEYIEEKEDSGLRMIVKDGIRSDIHFEKQDDGRFRTYSLTPDRAVKITAHADGFEPVSRTFKLPEGKTEEVAFVLGAK
jgi:beta-lactamase regulating signal transducer with metallopeptidase domain/protocatechuate 3,4-dioxygenase beta subunit